MEYGSIRSKPSKPVWSHPNSGSTLMISKRFLFSYEDLKIYRISDLVSSNISSFNPNSAWALMIPKKFQPPSFVAPGESRQVCRLKKSSYWLKRSRKICFEKFASVVQKFGLHHSQKDHSFFFLLYREKWIILLIYWMV